METIVHTLSHTTHTHGMGVRAAQYNAPPFFFLTLCFLFHNGDRSVSTSFKSYRSLERGVKTQQALHAAGSVHTSVCMRQNATLAAGILSRRLRGFLSSFPYPVISARAGEVPHHPAADYFLLRHMRTAAAVPWGHGCVVSEPSSGCRQPPPCHVVIIRYSLAYIQQYRAASDRKMTHGRPPGSISPCYVQ